MLIDTNVIGDYFDIQVTNLSNNSKDFMVEAS